MAARIPVPEDKGSAKNKIVNYLPSAHFDVLEDNAIRVGALIRHDLRTLGNMDNSNKTTKLAKGDGRLIQRYVEADCTDDNASTFDGTESSRCLSDTETNSTVSANVPCKKIDSSTKKELK